MPPRATPGRTRRRRGGLLVATVLAMAALPARGLETDQYYAWTTPLEDASAIVNAKVNREIELAIEEVHERDSDRATCHDVSRAFMRRVRFFIFQPIQIWVDNASLVDRCPDTPDAELAYRQDSIYPFKGLADLGVSIPPSPTIELDGVRVGTDKLAHFFSNGWRYFSRYRSALKRGLSEQEAVDKAIRVGYRFERTLLGYALSGVFSIGDMEANERGLEFFRSLCEGDDPRLVGSAGSWELRRPFDVREYVTPEWDESWRPSVYTDFRWRRVRRRLLDYCDELQHPLVVARREDYARRERETPTDRFVAELVARGRLDDPGRFSIEAVCGEDGAAAR